MSDKLGGLKYENYKSLTFQLTKNFIHIVVLSLFHTP